VNLVFLIKEEVSLLIVYVDDVIYASDKSESLKTFVDYMASEFEIRNLPPTRFLGLNMERNQQDRQIFISQRYTVLSLLEKYGMADCTPVLTPADPNARLTTSMVPTSEGERLDMTKVPYKSAVGALLYLANATRPDITYAVGQVAKYCSNPQPAHWRAVKRIMAYLKGTCNLGIWLGGTNEGVVCYGDADFAGDLDNRKSTSGSICFFRGGPVSWASRQQNTTVLSTTQSEYQALADVCKDAVWLNRFNAELNPFKIKSSTQEIVLSSVPIYCDNESAIKLAKNPAFHRRTKHFDVKLADIFTKPLPGPRFATLRERIGMGTFSNKPSHV
jgi:hypothetical protein